MTFEDSGIQLAAIVLLLYGLYEMGKVRTRGPFLAAVSEILWVVIGVMHSVPGLVILSVILAGVQGWNFVKWKREGFEW